MEQWDNHFKTTRGNSSKSPYIDWPLLSVNFILVFVIFYVLQIVFQGLSEVNGTPSILVENIAVTTEACATTPSYASPGKKQNVKENFFQQKKMYSCNTHHKSRNC